MPAATPTVVPPLPVNPAGRGIRLLGRFARGVRSVSAQIEPYTNWWSEQNQTVLTEDGPLWVVIGDSTALGIGASEPGRGYVGVVAEERGYGVINLAMSGARVRDGLERQLPILDELLSTGVEPSLVTMCLGSNDVFWRSGRQADGALRAELAELIEGLPASQGTPNSACRVAVTTVAGVSDRAKLANRAIRRTAGEVGVPVIDLWDEGDEPPSERIAADRFHPNDLGYRRMADAVIATLG